MPAPAASAASTQPVNAAGQCDEDDCRQRPAPEERLKEQENADGHGDGKSRHTPLRRLTDGIFAQELGTVFEREVDLLDALFDVRRNRGEISTAHIDGHVHATRYCISMDFGGSRHDADRCHVLERDVTAGWRVNQQVLQACQTVAGLGCAVHHHLEHLL